jgi:hypothetical protein
LGAATAGNPEYNPLPLPKGYHSGSEGPLSLFAALGAVTHCDDWQDVVAYCADIVWYRCPEALELEEEAFDAGADDMAYPKVRDFALRLGAVLGVGLARCQPQVPEGLLFDWIRSAVAYGGLEIYDVVAIPDPFTSKELDRERDKKRTEKARAEKAKAEHAE